MWPSYCEKVYSITFSPHLAFKCALVQCDVCDSSGVVTLKPCGHSVLCQRCAEVAKRCPNCKVSIFNYYNHVAVTTVICLQKPVKSYATQCLMCEDSTPGQVFPVKPCGHSFCRGMYMYIYRFTIASDKK